MRLGDRQRPEIIPQRDALEAYMREHNMTRSQFCVEVFGLNKHGKPGGAGQIYPILGLRNAAGPKTRQRFRDRLGLELPEVASRPRGPKRRRFVAAADPADLPSPRPAAHNAVEAYRGAGEPRPILPQHWGRKPNAQTSNAQTSNAQTPASQADPRRPLFMFLVNQDGSTSLSLNLLGVTAKRGVEALQVLVDAGLIKSPTEPEK